MDVAPDYPRFELDEHNCLTIYLKDNTIHLFLDQHKIRDLKCIIQEWEDYGY